MKHHPDKNPGNRAAAEKKVRPAALTRDAVP